MIFYLRIILAVMLTTGIFVTAEAQFFQFSQYNFSPQRINPGMVAASNFATASFLYRNQATGGGFHLTSNALNVSYPLINGKGARWSGVALSFLDDRAGQSGIYSTQEASLSYAVNIFLSKAETLSFGFRVLHAQRRIDLSGLNTGLQYIPDRGFDDGISSGENFDGLRHALVTFSSGLYWQRVDRKGNRLAYAGLSIFDLNKPNDAFLQGTHAYPSSLVFTGSARMYAKEKLSVYPEILYTFNAAKGRTIAGFVTSYELISYRNKPSDKIELITKYAPGRAAILGVQLYRNNFAFGVSYDFPLMSEDVENSGALELGVEWRRLIDPRQRQKKRNARDIARRKNSKEKTSGLAKTVTNVKPNTTENVPDTTTIQNSKNDLSHRLKEKQDSLRGLANPGDIRHEPLIVEEATLRFGFDFNSSELDENSRSYLDQLAAALFDNPQLKVHLTGHTDNVGSAKFNQRLSLDRAYSLKEQLIERGVEEGRIEIFGKGLTEPLNDNSTPEKRAANRRVEMKIIYEDDE